MIERSRLEVLLQELMPGHRPRDFSLNFLVHTTGADEERIRTNYLALKKKGVSDKVLMLHAELFGKSPESLVENQRNLRELGFSDRTIVQNIHMLGLDPELLKKRHSDLLKRGITPKAISRYPRLLLVPQKLVDSRYKPLLDMGFSRQEILAHPNTLTWNSEVIREHLTALKGIGAGNMRLLARNPETVLATLAEFEGMHLTDRKSRSLITYNPDTVRRKLETLIKMGIDAGKLRSRSELLGFSLETIRAHYQNHVSVLRAYAAGRESGKRLLFDQPQLLGVSSTTMLANVQYLEYLGIKSNYGALLSTKPQTKRAKMAWLLRELFDYWKVPEESRPETIRNVYAFTRVHPNVLVYSISTLEKRKSELRKKLPR